MSKSILITGCSTGFGFDAAKYLAQKGHTIYATMRGVAGKNKAPADALREFANSENVSITVLEIDVTSDDSVTAAVAQVPEVDVLINNAGVGFAGPVEAFSTEQFQQQMDVNVTGTFRTTKAVLPGMRVRKTGLVIQISSIAGRIAGPAFGIYHASKWALEGLSESWRYEVGPLGIDIVLVEPGPFATSFFGNIQPGLDETVMSAYGHVGEYSDGFGVKVNAAFEDAEAPTDPMLVVKAFEDLINTPAGQRPLRTVVGLDFGTQGLNDVVAPVRQGIMEFLEIADWDGPKG